MKNIFSLFIAVVLAAMQTANGQDINNHLIISGRFGSIYDQLRTDCDSIILEVYENHLTNYPSTYASPKKYISKIIGGSDVLGHMKGGQFRFDISGVNGPVYITLRLPMGLKDLGNFDPAILEHFFAEPQDSLMMDIGIVRAQFGVKTTGRDFFIRRLDIDNIRFAGKGAAKFDYLFKIKPIDLFFLEKLYFSDSIRNAKFNLSTHLLLLEKYRASLSTIAYEVLKADIAFGPASKGLFGADGISDSAKFLSWQYARYIVNDSIQKLGISVSDRYRIITDNYSGKLRDKLIAYFLFASYGWLKPEDADKIMQHALSTVKFPPYVDFLQNMSKQLQQGSPAYQFSLTDVNGKKVRLSDFKGKTVFVDFWYTGCGPCMSFYQSTLSKVEKAFEKDSNYVFITIAIDPGKAGWVKSVKNGNYTSYGRFNVINLYTEGQGKDHPVVKYYNVNGYPRPLIIDKQGRIYRSSDLRLFPDQLIQLLLEASKSS